MDGTLAEWRSQAGPEELYEKGYFASLRPYSTILGAVKSIWFAAQKEAIGVDLFILSSYLSDSLWAKAEKQEWLDTHLSKMFDAEHTLFVPCGSSKLDYVPGGVHTGDYLLDDYTPNLREWEKAGGTPIKVFNGCNGNRNAFWGHSVKVFAHCEENYRALVAALK